MSCTAFSIPRGATRTWTMTVRDEANALVNLTGARIYFRVTLSPTVIEKKNTAAGGSNAQIEVTGVGVFKAHFLHADTKDVVPATGEVEAWVLTAAGEYLQVIAPQPFKVTRSAKTDLPAA